MRIVGAFMAFNSDLYDVEKYLLKWLRVPNYVRGLGFKSYICQLCGFWFVIIFDNMLDHVSDNIIIKLY